MNRAAVLLSLVIALAWSFSSTLQGQQLQEGTWSGTMLRTNPKGVPGQPRSVSLEVKKIPDPHLRWRPGKGEVLNVTHITPQGRFSVSDLHLEKGSLSFSYRQESSVTCRLDRKPDGAYEGECIGEGATRAWRLTLTPPKGSG